MKQQHLPRGPFQQLQLEFSPLSHPLSVKIDVQINEIDTNSALVYYRRKTTSEQGIMVARVVPKAIDDPAVMSTNLSKRQGN